MAEPANADAISILPHALYAEKSNAQNPFRKLPVGLESQIPISHLLSPHVIDLDQKRPHVAKPTSRAWYSIPRDKLLFPLRVW